MSDIVTEIVLKTPIGEVKVHHSFRGVVLISISQKWNEKSEIIEKKFSKDFKIEVVSYKGEWNEISDKIFKWFQYFFSFQQKTDFVSPQIDNKIILADNFSGKVLRNLLQIQSGQTITYSELARMAGNSKACRAVGQAMRKNPLPLLVPCHRVIRSNGTSGHYMSCDGDNIKSWLLSFESLKSKSS